MAQTISIPAERQSSAVKALQWITIGWLSVELCVSLFAGIRACSVALTAFGADSAIELASAVVVLRRFYTGPATERNAARISGFLLYALGVYIVASSAVSIFSSRLQAEPTSLGMALLVAAGVIMPILGRAKKHLSVKTESRAFRADATQTNVCAYMSWIALAGLVVNFVFHLSWADSLAALLLLPIVLKEAHEASKGQVCRDC